MSLPNIMWRLWSVCRREPFEQGPNIEPRETDCCTITNHIGLSLFANFCRENKSMCYGTLRIRWTYHVTPCDYFFFPKLKLVMKGTFHMTMLDNFKEPRRGSVRRFSEMTE
ncbi:hypothetical protein Trydic_g18776 [Trypoxylus dichotomus]